MDETNWTSIIKPKRSLFAINLRETLAKKDLLFLFVKRDFISVYKQTILGPLWFFIEPALTTIVFTIIFGKIAGISTDGVPQVAFYLGGLICWNYFADSLRKTSNTFIENQHIFGKVYFPRLITPLSIVLSSMIKYGIQLLLFLGVFIYFILFTENTIHPNLHILLLPYLILLTGFMGLGFGMIISSLTTKYRDLRFLIQFGIQLWMYASPVIYPLSATGGILKKILILNPMTSIIEAFKYGFFGSGNFSWWMLAYSTIFTLVLFFFSVLIYNKTEQNFMDTV